MKCLLSIIIILLLISSPTEPLSADSSINIEHEDYARIYKEQGIWYGVINITDSSLHPWNCVYGRCSHSVIYIAFDRDTEALTSITYNYTTEAKCEGINLFGLCLGTKVPERNGTETVYDKSEHGRFYDFLTVTSPNIKPMNTWFDDQRYDYRIISNIAEVFASVELLEFTYILTSEEVDNVTEAIKDQYERDLNDILIATHLSFEQKEIKAKELDQLYSTYILTYGQELRSLCENEVLCEIESSSPGRAFPVKTDISSIFSTIIITIVIIVAGFTLFKELSYLILQSTINLITEATVGLYTLLITYLIMPMIHGTKLIITKVLSLIFWWTS